MRSITLIRFINQTITLIKTFPIGIETFNDRLYIGSKRFRNPNDDFFGEYIQVLYSLAYAVRMSPKAGLVPQGYFEYTVYPLEGVWDISNAEKQNYNGQIDKNSLIFKLMIRQPDFVSKEFAQEIIEITKKKKPHELLEILIGLLIGSGIKSQML